VGAPGLLNSWAIGGKLFPGNIARSGILNQILETAIQFFKEYDWPFTQNENENLLRTTYRGDQGEWPCLVLAGEPRDSLAFYSICPLAAPEVKLTAVAELITRVNYGLNIGNFELDFQDGEIRLKTSLDVTGDRLSAALMKNVALTNIATMELYLPAIMKVIYGNISAAQAVAEIEVASGSSSSQTD
jgi:hypothetical protein